jgi:hypothetical protein
MKKLIVGAALVWSSMAAGDPVEHPYDGFGSAAIVNGNKKLAHDQAFNEAMRDALVKGAGATIDTASIVEGGTLVQDRIYSHASGYIKSYNMTQDGPDSDDPEVWKVALHDVKIGRGDLTKDMEAIHAMLLGRAHPRLYVLVREQSLETAIGGAKGGKEPPALVQVNQGISLERFESQLTAVGWHFVDPEVASGKVHVENAMTSDLSSLNGRDFSTTGADYVVLGSVVVRPVQGMEKPGMGTDDIKSVELRAVVKIKATDTGETVASVEYSKAKSNLNAASIARVALEEAGDAIAAELSGKVLQRWQKNDTGVGSVHLLVSVADYDVLQAFEEQVQKGVANVKDVKEMSFNDGKADLSVMMQGTSSKQLAGSLSGKSVKGMQIKVSKVTEHTVEVKLVK